MAKSVEGGVAYVVPAGTALPTSAALPIDPAIKAGDLGTLAQDGLSIGETRESQTVPDFDGNDYITFQSKYSGEFKFKMLDVDKETVLALLHGAQNVISTPANGVHGNQTEINHTGEQLPIQGFLFTTRSGGKLRFDTIELGRVSDVAEFKLESQDASGVEVTLKASKDDAGRLFRTFLDDGEITMSGPIVKVFTIGSGVTDYTVTVDGQTTSSLSTMTAAALKTALEGLSTVGAGNVTVTGSSGGPLTASFTVPVSVVSAAGTGGTVSVA
ncbi:MAG: hypothetical protein WBA38_04080 [Gordonia sp. (in: high G+C Gram-positive bacteria)]|uniref:hypothetical protein n=1 Tax=Gordonia sp. (in: high G+C Gram-positive bacteria) TaxID=84139 RepID=UPI003C77C256